MFVFRHNDLQSAALLAILAVQAGLVGWLVAGLLGAIAALVISATLAAGASRVPGWTLLRMMGARPIHPARAPDLYRLVGQLSSRAGLEKVPQLAIIESPVPNAMTVGSSEQPVIGFTRGLLHQLPPREFAGVLAHEISHVVHGDVRTMALARSFAQITGWSGQFGLALIVLAALAGAPQLAAAGFVLTLGPPLSTLVMLALSRQREFAADGLAAKLTGDPGSLATALRRIDARGRSLRRMFGLGGTDDQPMWLRTHPGTDERIARLSQQPSTTG